MSELRSVSYGGGVQSTALLVLAAQGRIDFSLFLMANVGDDSEHPATLAYVREVAAPYAAAHGIELRELNKRRRDGAIETLYGKLTRPGSRSTSIPYRSKPDGPPMSRSCTAEFKIRVIGKELKRRGASMENRAVVGIGISLDEAHRANRKALPYENVVYPLIGIGEETGLRLRRADCADVIASAGLPVPPKSSCWFCPHHKTAAWADMRRREPDLFERAADLEEYLRTRNVADGNGPVFLSRAGIPLRDAIDDGQVALFEGDDGSCDSGWCFT